MKQRLFLAVAGSTIIAWSAYAATKGNIKYEMEDDRVVVSCVDNQKPIIRTAPRPRSGYYAVVVCEGKQK